MPHQFLHHFEFGPDAPEQGRIGVSESMPADALLNIEGFGNWPNVFAKDGCAPVRPSSLVQSARKGPGVTTYKLARLSPGDQRISELRMERDRLLRGLRLAATDDAEDDRSVTLSSPRSKSTSRHLSPNSSLCLEPVDAARRTSVRSRRARWSTRALISKAVSTAGVLRLFAPCRTT